MSALLKHIQTQQDVACSLCGVIEAIAILDNEKLGADAMTSLIVVAGSLAQKLNEALDSVNLPEGGAA